MLVETVDDRPGLLVDEQGGLGLNLRVRHPGGPGGNAQLSRQQQDQEKTYKKARCFHVHPPISVL